MYKVLLLVLCIDNICYTRVIPSDDNFSISFFRFFSLTGWRSMMMGGGYSEQAPLRVRVLQNGLNPGHQQLAVSHGTW